MSSLCYTMEAAASNALRSLHVSVMRLLTAVDVRKNRIMMHLKPAWRDCAEKITFMADRQWRNWDDLIMDTY